jgi:hypothetical protein
MTVAVAEKLASASGEPWTIELVLQKAKQR